MANHKRHNPEKKAFKGRSYMTQTLFECRCCGRANWGTTDGKLAHDDRGPWRRLVNIDGPDAVCPACVGEPDVLDRFVTDGYENAAIAVNLPKQVG